MWRSKRSRLNPTDASVSNDCKPEAGVSAKDTDTSKVYQTSRGHSKLAELPTPLPSPWTSLNRKTTDDSRSDTLNAEPSLKHQQSADIPDDEWPLPTVAQFIQPCLPFIDVEVNGIRKLVGLDGCLLPDPPGSSKCSPSRFETLFQQSPDYSENIDLPIHSSSPRTTPAKSERTQTDQLTDISSYTLPQLGRGLEPSSTSVVQKKHIETTSTSKLNRPRSPCGGRKILGLEGFGRLPYVSLRRWQWPDNPSDGPPCVSTEAQPHEQPEASDGTPCVSTEAQPHEQPEASDGTPCVSTAAQPHEQPEARVIDSSGHSEHIAHTQFPAFDIPSFGNPIEWRRRYEDIWLAINSCPNVRPPTEPIAPAKRVNKRQETDVINRIQLRSRVVAIENCQSPEKVRKNIPKDIPKKNRSPKNVFSPENMELQRERIAQLGVDMHQYFLDGPSSCPCTCQPSESSSQVSFSSLSES